MVCFPCLPIEATEPRRGKNSEEAVVVVDPYSSGRFYLYELKRRGYPIVVVRSSLDVGAYFKKVFDSHQEYFAAIIDFPNYASVDELQEALVSLPYTIVAVIAGSDVGVELADHLAEKMKMPNANGTELLLQRIDKASMQDQLRMCGIPAAEQIKSGQIQDLLLWARRWGKWPLVAKPSGGVGSEGIFFCKNEDDIVKAHGEIVGATNPKGVVNSAVALQEFLDGEEYIVDCISHEGRHICIAIWYQGKRRDLAWSPTSIMTTYNELLDPAGEIQNQLVNYTFQVLDAVGFKHGPSHNELMMTERGPILIEVNARMHGVQGPRVIELSTGTNKAEYACDIFVGDQKLFNSLYKAGPSRFLYQVKSQCFQLVLCCPRSGYYTRTLQDAIGALQLPSVVEVLSAKQVGDFQAASIDLPTSPGTVLMVHHSRAQLEADMRKIREAEEDLLDGIYSFSSIPENKTIV
jgi:biotin carboxylase